MSSRCKTFRCFLVAATLACALSPILTQAAKPPKPGGGSMTNPALVYVETNAVITIATADGQATQRLTGGNEGWSVSRGAPAWSPDGTMIAYLEDRDDDNSPYPALYLMNADGSNRTLAYGFTGAPEYTALTWLPGGFMHFSMNRDAHFLDLANGWVQSLGLSPLYTWVGPTAVGPGVDPSTPGARGLVAYSALESGVSQESDIYIAEVVTDSNGSLLLDPTAITRLALPGQQNFPVISPDGLQVVFYDNASADGGNTLALVDLVDDGNGTDFGTVRTLRQGGGVADFRLSPSWSPDSQWIAFTWVPHPANKRFGADFEIAKIRRDGTDFTNVSNSGQHQIAPNWNPAWDPAK